MLLMGADAGFEPAIHAALRRHRVLVEGMPVNAGVERVIRAAPDLIVLTGEAAKDCGNELLQKLSRSPQSSVVPVVILDDQTELDARLRAFKHGATAVIPRSASIDAIAAKIAELARDIPERSGAAIGDIGDATLEEFVQALSKQLRSGILSVGGGPGAASDPVRLVLGAGRPLAQVMDDFVKRVRQHVVRAEPLHYEFDERPGGTVQLFSSDSVLPPAPSVDITELRLAVADDDSGRADAVAQALRSRGASVVVTDLKPQELRLRKLRQFDPSVLIIGEKDAQGEGYSLLRTLREDIRLRWASLLVVRWQDIWSENTAAPVIDRLETALAALGEPERSLKERAELGAAFDTRLEVTGPARCLRALSQSPKTLRVNFENRRLQAQVDISENLIASAQVQTFEDPPLALEGPRALAALLAISSGKVHVQSVGQPAQANMMATVDAALNLAESESLPISPSMPVPSATAIARGGGGLLPAPPSWSSRASERLASLMSGPFRFRPGPSPKAKAYLIALGVLQCLFMMIIYVGVARIANARGDVRTQSRASRSTPPAKPASVKKPARAVASSKPRPAPGAAPRVTVEESSTLPVDRTGEASQDCDSAFGASPPRTGHFPGAAAQQAALGTRRVIWGDLEAAQRALCTAVAWDSENARFVQELTKVFILRRDGKNAKKWAERGVELAPNSKSGQELLGDALARLGKYPAARTAFFLAAGLNQDNDYERKSLIARELKQARAALKNKNLGRAERFFRRAAVLAPENSAALVSLSRVLLRLGEVKAAEQWAQQAVKTDAKNADAHLALGDALDVAGDKETARTHFERAIAIDPGLFEAKRRLRNADAP